MTLLMFNMGDKNLLSTWFIIVSLGFILGLDQTAQTDSDEDDDDDAVVAGNADPGPSVVSYPNLNLSCIFCNNVESDECNNPLKKLVPLRVCQNHDDVCYTMHTPFGVIDRGCYNPNRNRTTYVCSCNLCNNLPIKLLPVSFTTKQDWLADVIDLSRTKGLRKSILKKISCVQCEANTSDARLDPSHESEFNASTSFFCNDGIITNLPVQECSNDEICGIKYIKSRGYIWRGCVKRPHYNYWWSFCRKDLCNYEVLESFYNI